MPPKSSASIWFGRIGSPFSEFGIAIGILYMLDRLLRRVSKRSGLFVYELMAQPISDKPLLPDRFARNVRSALLGAGNTELRRMPVRPEILENRFSQRAQCLGVFRSGEMIGYIWFCFGSYQEDEVRCTYRLKNPDESVFDFDLYIFPEHRMGVGFAAVWHAANAYLHGLGVRHSYSRMTRFNLASRRAHLRLGSRCVARAIFLRLGSVEWMCASTAPYFWCTWSLRSRPSLNLGDRTVN